MARYQTDLRKLSYAPEENPLLAPAEIPTTRKRVRSGLAGRILLDGDTGEVTAAAVIQSIEECDADQFVKFFAAGIAATYELSKTAMRVFQLVLAEYEQTPMKNGFADSVYLPPFDQIKPTGDEQMSEYTYNRGLREIIDKGFLAPRNPGLFWVNPALFFKGDRVLFVKDYRRKHRPTDRQPLKSVEQNRGEAKANG